MEDKILVEVTVPAVGETYDIFIPLGIRLNEVLELVSVAINELLSNKYQTKDDTVFLNAEDGTIYDINKEISELGIKNGSRLMLM